MKLKLLYLFIYIGTVLGFSACSDDGPLGPDGGTYESVAIMYWMGDNSLSAWAEDDINELVQGKDNIPANSKIIIYADEANAFPVIYQLDAENGLQVWKQYTQEEDCTDSLTLLNNLKTIVKNFPAKSYGLTFGAHGSGWVWRQRRALGPDNSHSGNYLNVPTLRGVLEHLPHFSYVFFDVCFMQCIEVAYELRDVTDWVIGSPAEIPNPGAPYHIIEEAMCKGDALGIVEGYGNYYPVTYKGVYYNGALISAAKCSELDNLATTTANYIKNVFDNRQTISYNETWSIQKYSSEFSSYTFCYDMNSAMYNILSTEEYNLWVEGFNIAVPMRKANSGQWKAGHCNNPTIYDPDHFGGISMYIPQDGSNGNIKNAELQYYQWYKDAGWDQTGW